MIDAIQVLCVDLFLDNGTMSPEVLVHAQQLCLKRRRARGLERITIHALLSIIAMLFTALVALRLNRLEKARCITMLAR
ncbi:MAG: hypothetical protein WCD81_05640 [Candidatus Bathyarchaeia archaeon]